MFHLVCFAVCGCTCYCRHIFRREGHLPTKSPTQRHIRLLSHRGPHDSASVPVVWGASSPAERGPLIATGGRGLDSKRNVIGSYSGSYSVYRALAVAAGGLNPEHQADLTNTAPTRQLGPHPQWHDPKRIVSFDPYGALVGEVFRDHLQAGCDVRPTIAITSAHLILPEVASGIQAATHQHTPEPRGG